VKEDKFRSASPRELLIQERPSLFSLYNQESESTEQTQPFKLADSPKDEENLPDEPADCTASPSTLIKQEADEDAFKP
jgi:hypothetical protein